MTLVLRYAVRSDVGLLREGNEDSAYAGPRLLAVADGMGGHAAGEVASSLTIASMAKLDTEPPDDDMLAELSSAVAAANARLQEMIIANPAVEGMGTTLTALLWSDGQAAVCHIGDSRGYLLREGELYQITHDHTLVQSLVDEGRISAEDVSTHPQRSLLLRALDGRSVAEPDLSVHDAQAGDRYLLCSDGLSGVVSDETLRETLAAIEDPETVTHQLIELALHGGGPDNITCIVADVVETTTSPGPLTGTPVLAGAAANVSDPRLSTDGTAPGAAGNSFGAIDDHLESHFGGSYDEHGQPSMTAPQPMVAVDDLDPAAMPLAVPSENGTAVRARRSHRAQPKRARRSGRRRWPIVTTSLVVLLAVVAAGGYIAWRWTQRQYYVGADKGEVVIYRGISEKVAWINLSRPYRGTGIRLAQVPVDDKQMVTTAYASGSLDQVQGSVNNIRADVTRCKDRYASMREWVPKAQAYRTYQTAYRIYQAALARKQKNIKPPASVPNPGPQPTRLTGCPASAEFGIASSDLAAPSPGPSIAPGDLVTPGAGPT